MKSNLSKLYPNRTRDSLRLIFALFLIITTIACSQQSNDASAIREQGAAKSNASQFMAYEHNVEIQSPAEDVAAIHDKVTNDCQTLESAHCVVLVSSLRTGDFASARIQVRATSIGIATIIASLNKVGSIVSQTKTGEDLESTILDADKRLAMLKDYRSKLESLSARGGNDINALMQISKELTQVQSDIENLTGSRANLMQRIETELLTIEVHSTHSNSFWHPISQSLSDFGDNLSESLAIFITAIAYFSPWAALVIFAILIIRKFWRKKHN